MGNCVWFVVAFVITSPFRTDCKDRHEYRNGRLVLDQPNQQWEHVVGALQKEVESLKQQVNQQPCRPVTGTYIRWGRTTCPRNSTDLVYFGFAAGNYYTKAGGAADFLCLPTEPKWGVYDDKDNPYAGPIFGAEYEFSWNYNNGGTRFFSQDLYQHDAPCAVCHASGSTTLMIPGRNVCYPGWKLEYHGYLMSGRNDVNDPSATNYICLDVQAETEIGDRNSENGKLINFVEVACGTLKCPPYVENRELTCVVCSK